MEISSIEDQRKRQFALLSIAYALPLTLGFLIVDILEGDVVEIYLNIVSAMVLCVALIGITRMKADLPVYRSILTLLSIIFLYNTWIGSGNGTAIYWLFPFPLVFVFFLGKNEGGIAAAAFLSLLCIVMLNPFALNIYAYNLGVTLRFLASMLLVTLMAYGLEASREKYGRLLTEEQAVLLAEKQNLEQALGQIKTLSGLIPICSSCKKIRDDKGYWQQVEVYVRDHSSADFSHSICPDCVAKLYPDFPGLKKKMESNIEHNRSNPHTPQEAVPGASKP